MFTTLEEPYEIETRTNLNVAVNRFKVHNPQVTGMCLRSACNEKFLSHSTFVRPVVIFQR